MELKLIDYTVIFLFLAIILVMGNILFQIDKFMPTWESCKDDINITQRCGCVPCSWDSADKYNGNGSCNEYLEYKNR